MPFFPAVGHPRPTLRWLIDGETLQDGRSDGQDELVSQILKTGVALNVSYSGRGAETPTDPEGRVRSEEAVEEEEGEIEGDGREGNEKLTLVSSASPVMSLLTTREAITLHNVSRDLLMAKVECRAANSRSLQSVSATATLDMNCECEGEGLGVGVGEREGE